ncbi:hypothetical protein MAMC_01253 [Methylacidimicrobium cyclopophantes]|uniref:Uncharacterized protein n=1 Tax=Methylacidimicrobium cyclopophantes TaxID=1041766 RepID=A0A5E6MEK9_9BACT|nr:hypothetical protein [Methylacidimicrobium cyclopophantes]VVM06796.1 hypothetical protein MAMC_01253 [Methylacidimicrobium cyclopophantes]
MEECKTREEARQRAIGRMELRIGLIFVALFWPLNWFLPGRPTAWLFFPLWLGYILTIEGLLCRRTGSSLLGRKQGWFVSLFPVSAAIWWLFELLNLRGQNWAYVGEEDFPPWLFVICSSLSFSTVLPAVLVTAEWLGSFPWLSRFCPKGRRLAVDKWLGLLFFAGFGMLVLFLLFPKIFFPFLWTSLVFLTDPINARRGRPSLFQAIGKGDWRPLVGFGLAGLFCGFFWELWNSRSNPYWVYRIPFFDFWHLFAMPLPGYLGYPPFAWELYGLTHLVWPSPPLRVR